MATSAPIAPLPPQVVAQIRSSISITSLNGVIVELVKNSLDAQATKVDIQFSRDRGKCMVQDDGLGIAPSEFQPDGGLAKPHHTSKHADSKVPHYGSDGCFLASLSVLSIVTITSKHYKHQSQNSITLARGAIITRHIPALPEERIHGGVTCATRVIAYNLFGDMPVRVKQRAIEALDASLNLKEWDNLKKEIAALLLFWRYQVTVTMKDVSSQVKLRQIKMATSERRSLDSPLPLNHICQILYQAGFLSSIDVASWVHVAGSTSSFELQGGICLRPAPTKNVQFISFGIMPMLNDGHRNILYEDINRLFANSLFGVDDELPELDEREKRRRAEDGRFKTDGYTNKELKGSGKGVDRWPMFCMRIEMKEKRSEEKMRSLDDVFEDDNAITSITRLIQRVVVEFLKANNFMPKHVPKQQSSSKRDRYGSLLDADGFRLQPRTTSQDSPRKKLLSTPTAASKSPHERSNQSEIPEDAAAVPIPRTTSPFNIWPRVKTGRMINAPPVSKPVGPSDTEQSPSLPSKPAPVSRLDTSATTAVSSHFDELEPIVSKEGRVLRLPFLDVEHKNCFRKGSPRPPTKLASTLIPKIPRPHSAPTTSQEKDSAVGLATTSKSTPPAGDMSAARGRFTEATPISDLRDPSRQDVYRRDLCSSPCLGEKAKSPQNEEKDELVTYTDSHGRETYINTRTGQTVVPLKASITGKLEDGARHSNSRISTRPPGSLSQNEKITTDTESQAPSPFVASVLQSYKNPVFKPISEPSIPTVANNSAEHQATHAVLHGQKHNCSEFDIQKAFKFSTHAASGIGRLSKQGLRGACVVGQVDKKFILVVTTEGEGREKRRVLVLVDQHAADERIRIEALMSEYFLPRNPDLTFTGTRYHYERGINPGVRVEMLQTPITFETEGAEKEAFRGKQEWFAQWGVVFAVRQSMGWKVMVTALPPGIIERCRLEPKLIIDLMRKELYASLGKAMSSTVVTAGESGDDGNDWLSRLHNCPQGILDMLNSRACRSAIMFNDELSLTECKALIERVEKTKFPFMCAHGRPSMVPLVEVDELGGYEDEKEISRAEAEMLGNGLQ